MAAFVAAGVNNVGLVRILPPEFKKKNVKLCSVIYPMIIPLFTACSYWYE